MGSIVTFIVFIIIANALLKQRHKTLVFICVLSIFADNFRVNLGPSLLLANCIGFLMLPIVIKNSYLFRKINHLYRPLWLEFFYLILLGYIFGFLFPWETFNSDYRMWTQQASGRTVVTLFRLLNELIFSYYIVWCFITKKIDLKFIVYSIGYASVISSAVGFADYLIGYSFKASFFYMVPELSNRFLGLNGEPKMFGRNSALAYAILLLYYLTRGKDKKLVVFMVVNVIGVLISLSASSFILFLLLNAAVFFNKIKPVYVAFLFLLAPLSYVLVSSNPFFQENTQYKIEKAIMGGDAKVVPNEPQFFSRFDIFDRLGLVFLYENPIYAITGTGPNLISIPASTYVGSLPEYSTFAERGGIDSVPNIMINNVIARSGLLGVILFLFFYIRLFRFSKFDKTGFSKALVIISFIFNMVYFSIVCAFLTALIIGLQFSDRRTSIRKI
ncbi:MAG: hypothetical protein K0R77_3147 [Chryseobacterium sp.]|uniref:hypothetical protein n=1 Tax=Chryseobacterium sp. TaxID=1871047 RepID=UPI00260B096D|nr:hypothetical protein [Chryseobacterium sp.]MDF2553872.1 hypothetical protein [Chryseobacterium sp.]